MIPELAPMLAVSGDGGSASEPGDWLFEVKWDGYRALATVTDGRVRLSSRRGLDLTAAYPELGELGVLLVDHQAVLDGEVVALLPDGRSSFELLQGSTGSGRCHLMLFDLLWLDGHSLLEVPLEQRRELLEALVGEGTAHVHVPATFGTDRELALTASRQLMLEGVMAKRLDSPYCPGRRSHDWVKIKNVRMQSVVVIGWSPGTGRRAGTIGSLLLAVNTDDGLRFAGKAGSGFTETMLRDAQERLRPLVVDSPAVPDVPRADAKDATWVAPELVGEVAFGEWTSVGKLRHPVWRGFRDDLAPTDVVVES